VSYAIFLSVCTTTNLTLGTTFGGAGQFRILNEIIIKDIIFLLKIINKGGGVRI